MKKFQSFFINEANILALVVLNAITIIIQGFDQIPQIYLTISHWADSIISILFIIEMGVKINYYGRKEYFKSGWNRFDFTLVLLSAPSLLLIFSTSTGMGYSIIYSLRLLRIFKFFRFLKFVPHIEQLISGIKRAMKASVLIFFAFFIFNLVISLLSTFLFKEISPEHFGNPLKSFYSIFKIFTIEGWYEIPDQMAESTTETIAFFIKLYFITILLSGGVIGLSLVNSIFVDAMVTDNTNEIEYKIEEVSKKLQKIEEILTKTKNPS